MTFKSVDEIKRYIVNKIPTAVEIAMKDVWKIMDEGLEGFYGEYHPTWYDRTNQLRTSLVDPEVVANGNGAVGRLYYNAGRMSYSTGAQPSGELVLSTAMMGGHGAYGLKVIKGTPVWSKVYVNVASQINDIVKRALVSSGLPVR